MEGMLTLFIPTKNRSEFLIRLLHYYRALEFRGTICIGDASDAWHAERIINTIRSMGGKLRVEYQGYPGLIYRACFKKLVESVSTPYAAFIMDDDFLVPQSLEQCVRFLENHSDYNAAHGIGSMFGLDCRGPYGRLKWVGHYPLRAIEAETACQRLFDYLTNPFVTVFSVQRTETWRAMCRDVILQADWSFADELLPCCLSVIHGKVKQLICFYLAFQDHDQRVPRRDLFDTVVRPAWSSSYQIFRDCLAEELVRKDGISVEGARAAVKQAYWLRLARGLTEKWEQRYASRTGDSGSWLRKSARRIPGLTRVWRATRSWTRRNEDEISLPALLRPSSRYHTEFMPIYQAVTHPPTDLQESTALSGYLGRGATSS